MKKINRRGAEDTEFHREKNFGLAHSTKPKLFKSVYLCALCVFAVNIFLRLGALAALLENLRKSPTTPPRPRR
jgi:hypothetical protein